MQSSARLARPSYEGGPIGPTGGVIARPWHYVRDRLALGVIGAVALASAAGFIVTANPVLGIVPIVGAVALFAAWKLPLRATMFAYLFVAFAVFSPPKTPEGTVLGSGPIWTMLLRPIGTFIAANLNKTTGIAALRFSGAELIYVFMLALIAARALQSAPVDRAGRRPGVDVLFSFTAVAFAAVIWLELWGLAHGGADFQQSLWQFRQMLWLPVLTWMISYCLRGPRDFPRLFGIVTAAACLKILLGIYFLRHDVWPTGIVPESMTGHDDSMLYVVVLFVWIAATIHGVRPRRLATAAMVCGWVLLGIALNNRRIAYVSLVGSLFVLYTILHGRVKLWVTRLAICALPFLGLYLYAARTHTTGIFKPAAQLMSVSQQRDGSSQTREIENYNLIQTIKPNPLLGMGWGHEYHEVNRAYDISQIFAQYRYIAHNSVLWLLAIGGIVGFTLLWMPLVVGIFLATRCYRFARDPVERTAAAAVLAVFVAYVVQAWGDMGTQGGGTTLLTACALAVTGKLARATGAWTPRVRLVVNESDAVV